MVAAESVSLRQANTYDQNTEQEGEADEASSFEKQRKQRENGRWNWE